MGSLQEDPAMSNTSFNSNYIQVKPSQKGNPVLSCIRNVHWQYNAAIVPDYVMGSSTCALYISIRYHLVHPQYLYRRMKEVGRDYRLRVVVCKVDVEDSDKPLLELNKLCFSNRFTLLLTWSDLEAGRYIETLKAYETKPSSSIQQRVESEFLPKLTSVLRNVRQLNRTDVATLLDGFRSFQGICKADEQQLILCPGIGDKKAKRLYQVLHTPFKVRKVQSSGDGLVSASAVYNSNDREDDNIDLIDDS